MADKRQVIVEGKSKGLKEVTVQTKELGQEVTKTQTATRNLTKEQNKSKRNMEGTAQRANNAGKDFARMSQGLGGLVRVYATVAANVFALSSAYRILAKSADLSSMELSARNLAAATGRNFAQIAKDMQAASGGALDFAEALALANKAGATPASNVQIKELTALATKAAQTYGGTATDAMNRFVDAVLRGRTELVQKLGVVLNTDKAMQEYALSIGKTAKDLTQYEKQQALVTAIIKQGNAALGEVDIDPNPYQTLATVFSDLTDNILKSVRAFFKLDQIAMFFRDNQIAAIGALAALSAAIVKSLVPAIDEAIAAKQKLAASRFTDVVNIRTAELDKESRDLARRATEFATTAKQKKIDALELFTGSSLAELKATAKSNIGILAKEFGNDLESGGKTALESAKKLRLQIDAAIDPPKKGQKGGYKGILPKQLLELQQQAASGNKRAAQQLRVYRSEVEKLILGLEGVEAAALKAATANQTMAQLGAKGNWRENLARFKYEYTNTFAEVAQATRSPLGFFHGISRGLATIKEKMNEPIYPLGVDTSKMTKAELKELEKQVTNAKKVAVRSARGMAGAFSLVSTAVSGILGPVLNLVFVFSILWPLLKTAKDRLSGIDAATRKIIDANAKLLDQAENINNIFGDLNKKLAKYKKLNEDVNYVDIWSFSANAAEQLVDPISSINANIDKLIAKKDKLKELPIFKELPKPVSDKYNYENYYGPAMARDPRAREEQVQNKVRLAEKLINIERSKGVALIVSQADALEDLAKSSSLVFDKEKVSNIILQGLEGKDLTNAQNAINKFFEDIVKGRDRIKAIEDLRSSLEGIKGLDIEKVFNDGSKALETFSKSIKQAAEGFKQLDSGVAGLQRWRDTFDAAGISDKTLYGELFAISQGFQNIATSANVVDIKGFSQEIGEFANAMPKNFSEKFAKALKGSGFKTLENLGTEIINGADIEESIQKALLSVESEGFKSALRRAIATAADKPFEEMLKKLRTLGRENQINTANQNLNKAQQKILDLELKTNITSTEAYNLGLAKGDLLESQLTLQLRQLEINIEQKEVFRDNLKDGDEAKNLANQELIVLKNILKERQKEAKYINKGLIALKEKHRIITEEENAYAKTRQAQDVISTLVKDNVDSLSLQLDLERKIFDNKIANLEQVIKADTMAMEQRILEIGHNNTVIYQMREQIALKQQQILLLKIVNDETLKEIKHNKDLSAEIFKQDKLRISIAEKRGERTFDFNLQAFRDALSLNKEVIDSLNRSSAIHYEIAEIQQKQKIGQEVLNQFLDGQIDKLTDLDELSNERLLSLRLERDYEEAKLELLKEQADYQAFLVKLGKDQRGDTLLTKEGWAGVGRVFLQTFRDTAKELKSISQVVGEGLANGVNKTIDTMVDHLLETGSLSKFGRTLKETLKATLRDVAGEAIKTAMKKQVLNLMNALQGKGTTKAPELTVAEKQLIETTSLIEAIKAKKLQDETTATQEQTQATQANTTNTALIESTNTLKTSNDTLNTSIQSLKAAIERCGCGNSTTNNAMPVPGVGAAKDPLLGAITAGAKPEGTSISTGTLGGQQQGDQVVKEAIDRLNSDMLNSNLQLQNPLLETSANTGEGGLMGIVKSILTFLPSLLSMGGGGSGGGGIFAAVASLFGGGTSAANGAIFKELTRINKYASGAITRGPELALIGEGSNREAVVPLPNNREIPVDLKGSKGDNITINQSYDFRNADPDSVTKLRAESRNIEQRTFNRVFAEINKGGKYAKIAGRR